MRRLALLALAALLPLAAAWGQTAAPSFIPGSPGSPGVVDPTLTKDPTIVPTNPATLGWRQPTRIVAGVVRADRQTAPSKLKDGSGSVVFQDGSHSAQYEGSYAGGVYTGDRYGIAVETLSIRDTASAVGPLDDFRHRLAFGYALGDRLTAGAEYSFDSDRQDNNHNRVNGVSAGVSYRLGERFYLGAVGGQQRAEQHAINPQGTDGKSSSTILVGGVGYVSEGTFRIHIEVAAGSIRISGDNSQDVSAQLQTASFEGQYQSWVFGITTLLASGAFKSDTGTNNLSWTESEATVGVVSEHGFGVLYHYGFGTARAKLTFDPFSTQVDTSAKAQSLSIVWQY